MKYPFVKCEHPKVVRNRYTDKELLSACGICKSCSIARADKMSLLCGLEENCHKYCMFVTLTYAPQYLPLCEFVYHDASGGYCVFNRSKRITHYDNDFLGWFPVCDYPVDRLELLKEKVNLNGYFGYSCKRDLQLFLKRFRKRIFNLTYEKIRFYAVSEYGPVHFRPHFHLLFYFETERTLEVFSKALHKAWKYGRIDWSLSRGKCSSYVSQYVNSDISLPPVYSVRELKPFCSHSKYFASEFYQKTKASIYANEDKYFTKLLRQVSGKVVEFAPWRSLTSMLYPRCTDFANKSDSDLYYAYVLLRETRRIYGQAEISEYVRMILGDTDISPDNTVYNYFHSYGFDDQRLASRISSELYLSKHFIEFCCDGDYDNTYRHRQMVRRIRQFYSSRDYLNLKEYFQQQQEYIEAFMPLRPDKVIDDLRFFYDIHSFNDSDLKDFPLFFAMRYKTEMQAELRTKHREQNDANGIFL